MSLFKNLVETYDILSTTDFRYEVPIAHIRSKINLKITLGENGNFRNAERFKSSPSAIIPSTISSGSRTSGVAPHPLHDTLSYISLDEKKKEAYLEGLKSWKGDNPKLNSIYTYVKNSTILNDLKQSQVDYKDTDFVQFHVEIPRDKEPDLSKDKEIIDTWIDYYTKSNVFSSKNICYISGDDVFTTSVHPKGINSITHSALLVSTATGAKSRNSNNIGYISSQKAHSMLRYLVQNQGLKVSTGVIVAWSISDNCSLLGFDKNSVDMINDYYYDDDDQPDKTSLLNEHYAKKLRNSLLGTGNAKDLLNHNDRIAIVALDSATTGRMSITYYQELEKRKYLESIVEWHEMCHWHKLSFIDKKPIEYISAPSIDEIIKLAFGDVKGESYYKIKKRYREQLVANIFSGKPMDLGFLQSSLRRVNNPFSFQNKEGKFLESSWRNAINTLCAVYRMYYLKKKGEEYAVEELEANRTDRSYLYGRLLAIAEKIENHAMYKKDKRGKRITTALRYTQGFAQNPYKTWTIIKKQLIPYEQQLSDSSRNYYQNKIDEIMELLRQTDYTSNKALEGTYLMGYSLQRLELNKYKNTTETIDEGENDNE